MLREIKGFSGRGEMWGLQTLPSRQKPEKELLEMVSVLVENYELDNELSI